VTDISIFIPVYKESEQLPEMVDKLVGQDVNKEVFVTVDEPAEGFLQKMKPSSSVKLKVNQERKGKVNALNEAVKFSTGKILLFLDADVQLPDDPDFLKKIVMKMQHTDVLDIKKKVTAKSSFLSRMAYYEYFTFNVSSWLASKYLQKCPAVNGAAFAIKREIFEEVGGFRKVVAEDIDIATRAFLANHSFAYAKDVEVKNVVYSNWRNWFTQRKRWGIGQALWLKDWYKDLAKKCLKKPQIFLPGLFFLYPSIAVFFLSALVPSMWMYDSLWVFSLFLSVKLNLALPIFLVSVFTADLLKTLLIMLSSYLITSVTFFFFSKKLGFEIKLHELFVYYFFYSVLWVTIIIIGHIQVLAFRRRAAPNWRT
jgi:cellulose synthase/poly-beta-1,6-N-acetylglucosamine synthase-like glycosyltransferase